MSYDFTLSFASSRCEGCGGERIVTQSCRDCGFAPHPYESNPQVQRRCRIAARTSSALSANYEGSEALGEISSFLGRCADVVPSFFRCLSQLSLSGEDATDLEQVATDLRRLRAQADIVQPRPWRQIGRLLAQVLEKMQTSLELFLSAFAAPDILTAQARAERGQAVLDEVTEQTQDVERLVNRMGLVLSATPDNVLAVLAGIAVEDMSMTDSQEATLLALDAHGRDRVRRIVGADVSIVEGLGLPALWSILPAEVILDEERFFAVAVSAYELFDRENRIANLTQNATWLERHTSSQRVMNDGTHGLEVMLAAARNDITAVRAVLLFIQDIFEGPTKHLMATLLCIQKGRDYNALIRRDSGVLIKQCRQAFQSDLLIDLSEEMRNASAHLDFSITENRVVLKPGARQISLDISAFGDRVLATVETVSALNLALHCQLVQSGLGDVLPSNLVDLGLDPVQVATALLISHGWSEPTLTFEEDVITVSGRGSLRAPLQIIGGLLNAIPEDIKKLVMIAEEDNSLRTFSIPLANLRKRHREQANESYDEFTSQLDFLEACAAARIDGSPFLDPDAIRHYVAIKAGEKINGELGPAIARLKQLRGFARRIGDEHCATRLTGCMRAVRLIAQGVPPDADVHAALAEVTAWEATPYPVPFAI